MSELLVIAGDVILATVIPGDVPKVNVIETMGKVIAGWAIAGCPALRATEDKNGIRERWVAIAPEDPQWGIAFVEECERRGWTIESDDGGFKALGGRGSGNFGHAGRPGEVGGSQPGDGRMDEDRKITIASTIKSGLTKGKSTSAILAYVKDKFPNAKTSPACVAWYKSQMKKLSKSSEPTAPYVPVPGPVKDPTAIIFTPGITMIEKYSSDFILAQGDIQLTKQVFVNAILANMKSEDIIKAWNNSNPTTIATQKLMDGTVNALVDSGMLTVAQADAFKMGNPVPSKDTKDDWIPKDAVWSKDIIAAGLIAGKGNDDIVAAVKMHASGQLQSTGDILIEIDQIKSLDPDELFDIAKNKKDVSAIAAIEAENPDGSTQGISEASQPQVVAGADETAESQVVSKATWIPDNPKTAADVIRAGIKANAATGDIVTAVKDAFPQSKADATHIAWYKTQMKKAGQLGGKVPTTTAPQITISSKPVEPWPNDAPFPDHLSELSSVKGLGGSTGAKLVKDTAGNLWVYKEGASAAHVRVEEAANAVYRAAGIAVPPSKLYEEDGKVVKLSAYLEGESLGDWMGHSSALAIAEMKAKLQSGFHVDALLGNYDVIGASKDNILVGKDGTVWRIDNGGTFSFRAQGKTKGAAKSTEKDVKYDAYARDFWTMRDPSTNPTASNVFKDISWYAVSARLEAMPGAQVAAAIKDPGMRAIFEQRVANMKSVAASSLDYQQATWKEVHADKVSEERIELRSRQFVESLPEKMTYGGNSYTDEKGKPGDGFLSLGVDKATSSTPVTPQAPKHPIIAKMETAHAAILAAGKTVAFHSTKGDGQYNMDKLAAMDAAWKDMATVEVNGTKAKQVLAKLEDIKNGVSAAYKNQKVPDHIDDMDTLWKAVGGMPKTYSYATTPAPAPKVKPTAAQTPFAILQQRFKEKGVDYDATIGGWQHGWASASVNTKATAFRAWVAEQSDMPHSAFAWPGGTGQAELQSLRSSIGSEKLDWAFRTQAAYMQEMLNNVDFPNMDNVHRVVRIVRAEPDVALSGISNYKSGDVLTFKRMSASPGSHMDNTPVKGNKGTAQAVPFVNILSNNLMSNDAAGSHGFCGWGENEWIFQHSGKAVKYVGYVKAGPVADEGKDMYKWNLPLHHLRT